MSFPDFSKVQLDLGPTGPGPVRSAWNTPEGLTVETAYGTDAIEALDTKGAVVGWIASGPTVNLATQGVRIRSGQAVSISLRMDDGFSGSFTVRAYDPATQALLADLKLKTEYYDA